MSETSDYMNKKRIEALRIWSALYLVEKQLDLRNVLIKEDFIELSQFIQKLINLDFIEYSQGRYSLTIKGRYKKKQIEKKLELKGGNTFIVPDFNVLVASIDEDNVYLP